MSVKEQTKSNLEVVLEMQYYKILCVLIVTVVFVLDIVRMLKARKQINDYKYKVFNWMTVITILSVILLFVSSAGSLLSYFKSDWEIFLLNAYIFFVVAIQFSFHSLSNNYICDTGILYWGQLYSWSNIISYDWSSNEQYVIFKLKKKYFWGEDELRFKIKECLREEIKAYLDSHLTNLEYSHGF